MILAELPPVPKIFDYPSLFSVAFVVLFASIMLVVSKQFDATGGPLTISLIVVLAMVAVVAFSMIYNIPADDEVTPAVVGGLVAAFGAVVAYWLGRSGGPKN
jgi:uncharacterized BrkB/YihY/UPF0761 family membrane protein